MPRKIEISHKSIIFTVLFLIFLWFLFYIKEIIFIFFISLLIMTILNPSVSKLSRLKLPRGISVLIVYLAVFGVIASILAGVVPALISQTTNFTNNLPDYLGSLGSSSLFTARMVDELASQLSRLPAQLIHIGFSIFSNVLSVITVIIFSFYLLIFRGKMDDQLAELFGEKNRTEIDKLINSLEYKLGGWVRGELALMFFVGLLNFIGLTLLGIPYALPLALLAGLLEIVPNFGPVIAAIPAIIIGFGLSPITGFAVIALAFLVQQVENYLLVPKIMERSIGVNPIVTLLALAIGLKLAGVVGVLVSVPVLITGQVFLEYYLSKK